MLTYKLNLGNALNQESGKFFSFLDSISSYYICTKISQQQSSPLVGVGVGVVFFEAATVDWSAAMAVTVNNAAITRMISFFIFSSR